MFGGLIVQVYFKNIFKPGYLFLTMCKIVGVISLKGGVGKTSVTASLGDALANLGKKVLLVDGNLSAPNLGLHFNVVEPGVSLHDVLARDVNVSDAVQKIKGFDLIPSSPFKRKKVSPMKIKDALAGVKKNYDVIVIDSSPSLGEETLGVMFASDELVVVSTPDHPTLSNTISSVKLAKRRGTPIIGIVLNKVYGKNYELSLKDVEEVAEVPVMAVVPYDVKFLKALSEFEPYTSYRPKSKASEEIMKLASLIVGEKYSPQSFRKFFSWISPERQEINRQIYYESLFDD